MIGVMLLETYHQATNQYKYQSESEIRNQKTVSNQESTISNQWEYHQMISANNTNTAILFKYLQIHMNWHKRQYLKLKQIQK